MTRRDGRRYCLPRWPLRQAGFSDAATGVRAAAYSMRREIGAHKTESEGNSSSRLAEILDQLPIAVTLFDRAGQFIVRSGALRRMFGERIPARDPEQAARWKGFDYEGRALDPPERPGGRGW